MRNGLRSLFLTGTPAGEVGTRANVGKTDAGRAVTKGSPPQPMTELTFREAPDGLRGRDRTRPAYNRRES